MFNVCYLYFLLNLGVKFYLDMFLQVYWFSTVLFDISLSTEHYIGYLIRLGTMSLIQPRKQNSQKIINIWFTANKRNTIKY